MIDRSTSSSALAIVVVCFVLAAAIVAAGRQPEQVTIQPRALPPVMIISTPLPAPTPDGAMAREVEALRARVAELEAERQAQPQAEAPNTDTYQQMNVENAPAPQPTQWTADPVIVHEAGSTHAEITVPDNAVRYCMGFGDWRDYDAMYASSPVCRKP